MSVTRLTLYQAALASLLFFYVFLSLSLLIRGNYLFAPVGILAAIWMARLLTTSSKPYKAKLLHKPVLVVPAFWMLTLLMSASQELSQSLVIESWIYILAVCSQILLINYSSSKVSLFIATVSAVCLFSFTETIISFMLLYIPLIVFLIVLNCITRYILKLQADLQIATTKDKLTGCVNIDYLKQELNRAVELQKRYETSVSAICIDIECYFSRRYLLESCIKEMAQVCQSRLRQTDTLCRYSDSRFIILLPSTKAEDARSLAKDLIIACEAYNFSFVDRLKRKGKEPALPRFSHKVFEYQAQDASEKWFQKLTS